MLMNETYNQKTKWKAFLFAMMNMSSGVILLIIWCSFNSENCGSFASNPERYKDINSFQIEHENKPSTYNIANNLLTTYFFDGEGDTYSLHFLPEIYPSFIDSSGIPTQFSGYFHKVYYGNGLDHMNINLVDIVSTGLMTGDEIGVFDGINCVGSSLIGDQNMQENNLSITASVNDTIESNPNGYIELASR
jgi:hypothetical protein